MGVLFSLLNVLYRIFFSDVWRSVSQFQERGPKTPAAFRDNSVYNLFLMSLDISMLIFFISETEYSVQDEIVNVLQTQQNTPSTSSAILNHRRINTSQMITGRVGEHFWKFICKKHCLCVLESDNTLTLLLNIREQNNEILALLREFQIETCSILT